MFAARRDHLQGVIEPALARGAAVVCDRFSDATFAYQGGGRGVPLDRLSALEDWVQAGVQPDLTLWFDLDPELAARRRAAARSADRFEREDVSFFERVRAGYLARIDRHPQRFVRIDASLERGAVAHAVALALEGRGW
jgi:dTMP kinase